MSQEESVDYRVVFNNEQQFSIWWLQEPLPTGWHNTTIYGSKDFCLLYIENNWKDVRPLSLRELVRSHNTANRLNSESLNKHQNMVKSFRKRYDNGLDSWSNYSYLKECIKVFMEKYATKSPLTIFEVGIGSGISSEQVLEMGHKLTAIDVATNQNWIELKNKWQDNFSSTQSDIISYQTNDKYDIIIDNGCFHHLEPELYNITLKNIFNLMHNDSLFALAIFKEENTNLEEGQVELIDAGLRRCKFFTENEIENLLSDNGFKLIDKMFVSRNFGNAQVMICVGKKQKF